jgi:hypothetical protein
MLNTNFSNKTQLKIKKIIEFFLLGGTRSNTSPLRRWQEKEKQLGAAFGKLAF